MVRRSFEEPRTNYIVRLQKCVRAAFSGDYNHADHKDPLEVQFNSLQNLLLTEADHRKRLYLTNLIQGLSWSLANFISQFDQLNDLTRRIPNRPPLNDQEKAQADSKRKELISEVNKEDRKIAELSMKITQ